MDDLTGADKPLIDKDTAKPEVEGHALTNGVDPEISGAEPDTVREPAPGLQADPPTQAGPAAQADPPEPAAEQPGAEAIDAAEAAISKGAFWVVLRPRAGIEDDTTVKKLEMRPLRQPNEGELDLYTAISGTYATLLSTFADPQQTGRLNGYLVRLSHIARAGLQAGGAAEVARIELANLRTTLLSSEAPRVKNAYMLSLARWGVLSAAIGIVIVIASRWALQSELQTATDWADPAQVFALLWIGAMFGCWLSFGVRNPRLSFEALAQPDAELLRPPLRLLFTGLLSLTLGLAFVTGVVGVAIGDFSTQLLRDAVISHAVTTHALGLAVLVGVFCGIGEQALSVSIGQRAEQFIGEASK